MLHHTILGDGTPLVILHGVRLDHRHMMESLEPMFDTLDGWQRIYVDMPGHGLSPGDETIRSMDDVLDALVAFTDDILPDQKFGVIGESRGSYLARGMAHKRADQVLGLGLIVPGGNPGTDPACLPPHEVLRPDASLRDGLADNQIYRFENLMVIQNQRLLDLAAKAKIPAMALFDAEQEARVFENFHFAHEVNAEVQPHDGPTVIFVGRQDAMSGYLDGIDLLKTFPRGSLAVLDTAGHAVAWERPEVFQALMRDWLERLAKE
ncbi:MAG: alpha/beta hydrolase [Boseongicola sp.]|nr:alpha/beta hydrolase [Boseongicola sp.]